MGDTGNIDDFSNADSVNLKTIDGQKFTIVAWERSDYEQDGKNNLGIKLTTKDGKYHTTRTVIVQKFYKVVDGKTIPTKLGEASNSGTEFEVVCKEQEPKKGGNKYFDLVSPNSKQETI